MERWQFHWANRGPPQTGNPDGMWPSTEKYFPPNQLKFPATGAPLEMVQIYIIVRSMSASPASTHGNLRVHGFQFKPSSDPVPERKGERGRAREGEREGEGERKGERGREIEEERETGRMGGRER